MPGVISVGLPDGSTRELAEGTTGIELAQSIGSRLAKAAVVATVDGKEVARTETRIIVRDATKLAPADPSSVVITAPNVRTSK